MTELVYDFFFLVKIIVDPTEVSPDGLYQKDIVLSKDQAYNLFSKYFFTNSTRTGRKVVKNALHRWPLPIHYYFDDAHCNLNKIALKKLV